MKNRDQSNTSLTERALLDGVLNNCITGLEKVRDNEIDWYVMKDNLITKMRKLSSLYESLGDQFLTEVFTFISQEIFKTVMTEEKLDHIISFLKRVQQDEEIGFEDYYELQKYGEVSLDLDSFFSGGEILHFK